MNDKFKFSEADVMTIHNNLNTKNEEFKQAIDNLTATVKEIESSTSWKDPQVKTAYINTINTYLTYYDAVYTKLTGYTNYLSQKAKQISQFESNYSKG